MYGQATKAAKKAVASSNARSMNATLQTASRRHQYSTQHIAYADDIDLDLQQYQGVAY